MKTHSYKKRRKASVIACGPSYSEAIKTARSELGLPTDGFTTSSERDVWYKRHHKEHTDMQYDPLPRYYWHFPKEFVELLESFSYSSKPSRVNYYPNVPLDRYAMELIRTFNLPEDLVDQVKENILGATGYLGIGEALQLIMVPVNEDEEGNKYIALVAGIDDTSTRDDWLEVWKNIKTILRLSGVSRVTYKRPMDKLLVRDLTFWKGIKEGKKAKEVINEWVDNHPEDLNIGEDTLRKAVKRIDEIMQTDS